MERAPRSAAAAGRALRRTGQGEGVRLVRRLPGGSHALTWLVEVVGRDHEAVLREFPAGDPAAGREAEVLVALDGLGGLAPRLLAVGDPDDDDAPPWILISRLPGAADITSHDPAGMATALGGALARVHATPVAQVTGLRRLSATRAGSPLVLTGPAAPAVRARWAQIAAAPVALVHHDFWAGNVVWQGRRLSGVVDWSGAVLGPRGFDVGWCRLDLVLLHDDAIADAFLAAYEAACGAALPAPELWDLWSAARSFADVESWDGNYLDLGRRDLTAPVLRRRHDRWTRRLLGGARG